MSGLSWGCWVLNCPHKQSQNVVAGHQSNLQTCIKRWYRKVGISGLMCKALFLLTFDPLTYSPCSDCTLF